MGLFLGTITGCGGADEKPDAGRTAPASPAPVSAATYDVTEKSIRELAAALDSGTVTSRDLVDAYLARIEAYDQQGPALNAMIAVNADARAEADRLDAERAAGGVRGPLHGIPILVKDNYDTADMPTTAGTLALATSVAPDDAFQVRRLKDAGAIILGKTNMHELARGITTISSLGGQTRNPYDPTRNPGGSSGGTGAAVAASFGAAGMGSDTCGSIRIPAAHQALVGLRGTRGLSSRDGIIPLSATQDIGGPLARSVEDLALVLDATVGPDPADGTTALAVGRIPETYTAFLDRAGFGGARIGVLRAFMGSEGRERAVTAVIDAAVEEMTRWGAEIVEVEAADLAAMLEDSSLITFEFKWDFDAYLDATPDAPIRSLAEGQGLGVFHQVVAAANRESLAIETLDTDEYRRRVARRDEVREAVMAVMEEQALDALLYPTIRQTAQRIGEPQPGTNCALSAVSGLPAISVPAGFAEDDMPVGVELLGRPFAEPTLIRLAYAFEQGTHHRRAPDFTPSLSAVPGPIDLATGPTSADAPAAGVFRLNPATRAMTYDVAIEAGGADVLSVSLHRRAPDGDNGPVLRQLSGRGTAETRGAIVLDGREMHALRTGRLYAAVHTVGRFEGAARFNLVLPDVR